MSATWVSYSFPLDGASGSAVVDIDAVRSGMLHDKPFLCTVDLSLLDADPGGQSTAVEDIILYTVEATLERLLTTRHGVRYVGRYTLGGHRVFCFYSPAPGRLEESIAAAMRGFPAYRYSVAILEDPDWAVYTTLLYPSTNEFEHIIAGHLGGAGEPLRPQLEPAI
jgi:hypothetical protein